MPEVHLLRRVAAGLLVGCAASWVMNQFQHLKPIQIPGAEYPRLLAQRPFRWIP